MRISSLKITFLLSFFYLASGCGTVLPPVLEFEVVDTKATPQELSTPSIDPIASGKVTPFTPPEFYPVEILFPEADQTFGLTFTVDKGDWAKTQNTDQLLVEGRRVTDKDGRIVAWSDLSDTGFFTYMVYKDRIGDTPDKYLHYDLRMIDARKPSSKPQTIATVAVRGSRSIWNLSGESVECEEYFLTSRGLVLLNEEGSVVTYFEVGNQPVTTTLPVGYKVTSFGVTGDMAYSKHIRIIQHRGPHKLLGMLPSAQEELYDVSWLNLETGAITATAKDVVVNVENERAFRNHINGASRLINAKSGPLVISVEDTLKKTIVRNLATLQKETLVETSSKKGHGFEAGFERQRSGGIGEFHKVWIRFSIGNGDFSNKQINDLESWMRTTNVSLVE